MIFLGLFGKFGSVFITIPDPVIGGMFLVMFGMIAAVGISNLQVTKLNWRFTLCSAIYFYYKLEVNQCHGLANKTPNFQWIPMGSGLCSDKCGSHLILSSDPTFKLLIFLLQQTLDDWLSFGLVCIPYGPRAIESQIWFTDEFSKRNAFGMYRLKVCWWRFLCKVCQTRVTV